MGGSKWKQRIVDDYLNASRRNSFVPGEFLAWLKDKPEHECYPIFYGMSDADAAAVHREELVRRWISGLRVVVRTEAAQTRQVGAIEVREHVVPRYHSPVAGRRDGGGYIATDPSDPTHRAELGRQAAVALTSWLDRYAGTAGLLGIDTSAIAAIRVDLDAAADEIDPPEEEAA